MPLLSRGGRHSHGGLPNLGSSIASLRPVSGGHGRPAGGVPKPGTIWVGKGITALVKRKVSVTLDALLARQEPEGLLLRDTDRTLARLVGALLAEISVGSEMLADAHAVAVAVEAGGAWSARPIRTTSDGSPRHAGQRRSRRYWDRPAVGTPVRTAEGGEEAARTWAGCSALDVILQHRSGRPLDTFAYPYPVGADWEETAVADANVRIPAEARDRLAEVAAAEGLSLRAYLARLASTLLTPAERAERAERARAVLREWSGYDPTEEEAAQARAELDRRLARALGR